MLVTKQHSLLTPAMLRLVKAQSKTKQLPLYKLAPAQARRQYEKLSQALEIPSRALARVEDHQILASDGYQIPIRLYAPSQQRLPVLIYLHGGGYVVGSINTHQQICRELSFLANCAVIAVDYRLAPEHIFPTAVEDCWSLLQQLLQGQLERLNLAQQQVVLAGDSAGATLAAVLAIMAAKADYKLLGQILLYPGASAYYSMPSAQQFGQGFLLEQQFLDWAFQLYAPRAQMRESWQFAPLLCDDVSGVAPAWLGLAECDPLFDEGIAYADHLRQQLVAVELEVYYGVTHEFIKMGSVLPQARQALADMAKFARQQFN